MNTTRETIFRNKTRNGFTLIEILVAVTIIAVLLAIAVVSYTNLNKRSRNAKRYSDLEQLRSALELYRSDNGFYPQYGAADNVYATVANIPGLVAGGYMPALPTDPNAATPFMIMMTSKSGLNFYGYCLAAAIESSASNTQCATTGLDALYIYSLKNP